MLKHKTLEHRFVRSVPEKLEPGVLYVSMEFGSIVHSCCCGCGEEVVTPLTPTDWKMMYDGETVSMWPSVGSWTLTCKSHYIIERNRVIGSGAWTPAQIAAERRRDQAAKAKFYGTLMPEPEIVVPRPITPVAQAPQPPGKPLGFWARLKRWWTS
jgi:Family of unknown function (DUF6527)